MALDIRFASLSERLQRQLMQASNFIHTSYEKVTVSRWNGMPCELLVADATDPYGQYAIDTVAYRGTPVIAITANSDALPHPCVSPDTSTARLTRTIQDVLRRSCRSETEPDPEPLLIRLARHPSLRGRDLDVTYDRHTLSIRPSHRCAFAHSYSELHRLGSQLMSGKWTVQAPESEELGAAGAASTSLEALYLRAANDNLTSMPPFEGTSYSLAAWPQLEDTINLRYPVKVIESLVNGTTNPAEIARRCNLSVAQVSACLWSFRAAGSLQTTAEVSTDATVGRRGLANWLARLGLRSSQDGTTALQE